MTKFSYLLRLGFLSAVFFYSVLHLQAQPPAISFQQVAGNFDRPVDVVNAHDGSNRLFIVQQRGGIKVWDGTTTSDFMNLSSIVSNGDERGLLSMAFHPLFNGTTNRYFFVYYTDTSGAITVSRYQTKPGDSNTGDPSTGTVLITIPHTDLYHNGGKLNFGKDGYLYFATGDAGGTNDPANSSQTGTDLLGKMLRLNVDHAGPAAHPNYAIPADNPYVGSGTIADEVWNLGLRNPFRWSFDRANGDMWIGDAGESSQDEIDYRPADSTGHNNFGWRCYEGYIHTPGVSGCSSDTLANYVPPVYALLHPANTRAGIVIIGGYVYRGSEYKNLFGYYIATEFFSGDVYLLSPNGKGGFDSSKQTTNQSNISAFGEGEDGTLYAVSPGGSGVYKVVAKARTVLPVVISNFAVTHFNSYNELKWTTVNEQNTASFYIEYSTDGTTYTRAAQVAATKRADGNSYSYQHQFVTTVATYYRIAIENEDGTVKYSSVIKVSPFANNTIRIYPTIIRNGILNVELAQSASELRLVNATGAVVFQKNIQGVTGTMAITLPSLSKGLYYVQVVTQSGVKKAKVVIE